MTKANQEALTRACSVLREVNQKLVGGVNKSHFEEQYEGKRVSPGVTVKEYVNELRLGGYLEETSAFICLKSS